MKFGVDLRRERTGADLAVLVFQIASLLPVCYVLIASGYPSIVTQRGLFSVLFGLGCSAIPRAEAFALSALYRLTTSEIVFSLLLLAIALLFGVVMKKRLHGEVQRVHLPDPRCRSLQRPAKPLVLTGQSMQQAVKSLISRFARRFANQVPFQKEAAPVFGAANRLSRMNYSASMGVMGVIT